MPVSVVVVDDDPGFRRVARVLLSSRGAAVVAESADGAAGIEAVCRLQPDCVLLDVNLPDQDGLSVARTLRDGGHQSKVMLTSTNDAGWSAAELVAAGIRLFLTKDQLFDPDLCALFSR